VPAVILIASQGTGTERNRLSFFDEADDEPRTESRSAPRTASRAAARRRGSSGGGRRPPGDQQSIQVRRAVAAGVLVVIVLLMGLLIHSCQVSQANSALRDYTNSVSSLVTSSAQTGSQLFRVLSSGQSATTVNNQVNAVLHTARGELSTARGLSPPDQVRTANQNLVIAMRMRVDGITNIASHIQTALGNSSQATQAVTGISAEMARFYASDVLYKDYSAPQIAGALHGAGITIGGTNGATISGAQFLPSVQWLIPNTVAAELHVAAPGLPATGKPAPGLHGHSLDSVSVDGTTLQTGSTNTIPAKPAPTFSLNYTNGGTNNETDVVCKVTVTGTGVGGQKVVAQTIAGQHGTCQVTLSSSPPAGTYTVDATIEKVLGEKNTGNNSLSFPVTFQ
jgi:hypothetical protein